MTNREKYAKAILDIICGGENIAIDRRTNKPERCCGFPCRICLLNAPSGCERKRIKNWANAEYIEKPRISESDRRFLDYIPGKYKWMARDKDGYLHVYDSKVEKTDICWRLARYVTMDMSKFKISFPMVKWEDIEPWSIEDLKKLEVEG